jgi:hypothetical protein
VARCAPTWSGDAVASLVSLKASRVMDAFDAIRLGVETLGCASGLLGFVHGSICLRDEFVCGDFVACPGEAEGCS